MPKELTPQQLERFEKCYSVYRKKKSRGQAEATWCKWDFDDEMTNKIQQAICAQNRAGSAYCETKYLPNFSTYLNAKGWEDEIPSLSEKNAPNTGSVGHTCVFCSEPVKIKWTLCQTHYQWYRANYGPTTEERKEWFLQQGIVKEGMSKTEVMKAYRKSRDKSLEKLRSKR